MRERKHGRPATPATRLLGGLVVGTLAFVLGATLGGTGLERPPLSAAAEEAAAIAAVRIVLGGDEAPESATSRPEEVKRQPFAALDITVEPRVATRVVVEAVGIDADVRSVGYTFTNGSLAYDVPRRDAGQYVGTAAPGERGNTVIAGHVSSRGGSAVFEELLGVNAGDIIDVYRGDVRYQYAVKEIKVVAADTTSVTAPTDEATLTLITCFPGQDFSERFVVVGDLI
jgi:LPXTG-site transpeptidase (sortase) family protein